MKLEGTYTEENLTLNYVCRVIPYKGKYYDGIGGKVEIKDGDVLMMLGKGTWFALYRQ